VFSALSALTVERGKKGTILGYDDHIPDQPRTSSYEKEV